MRAILLLTALIGVITVRAGNLDIVFVIDGSTTVCGSNETCPAWIACLQFVRKIVETWDIGPNDTKVAFVTFGEYAKAEWNLDGHTDKASLLIAIDNVPFPGGVQKTAGTVRVVVDGIFNTTNGDRSSVSNVYMLITDGLPVLSDENAANSSAKLQGQGITRLVVCIQTGCTESFAHSLATQPKEINKSYFLVDKYVSEDVDETTIDMVREDLLEQINVIKDG